MSITLPQQLILVALIALGTMLTRFAPFLLFPKNKPAPTVVRYLGNVLPCAVMALLVVYCLKDVSITGASHGLPELISIIVIVALHAWKKNNLLSIGGGTILYMCLVQFVFV